MMGPWDREDGFGHFVKNEDFLKSGIVLKIRDSFGAGLIFKKRPVFAPNNFYRPNFITV
jgi:hypothetical protein